MGKYAELSDKIIKNIGGKENINTVTHCLTRLRFNLKDKSLVNEKVLKSDPRIISTAHASGEFQVIIGNSVADVYEEVTGHTGTNKETNESNKNKDGLVTQFINVITRTITPTLGVLVATGLFKGLLAILIGFNLINIDSGTYIILNGLGDALFYFFPVILGYTSAEAFGLNRFVGMALGATLMHPIIFTGLLEGDVIFSLFAGTPFALEAYQSFLGIPIVFPEVGYTTTVIPIILINYFASYLERFLKKYIPDIVGFAFTPFLTLLIVAPLSFIIIGPIASLLSNLIGWGAVSMFEFSPILASIIVALVYQPLVIFGLHWPLITIAINNFTTMGYDFLWPAMFTASFTQTAVVIAVSMKTNKKDLKSMSLPAIISGMMCIIEPAIYGFTLPDKKRFAYSCIGSAIGAVIVTMFNAVQYSFGIGLFGFAGFINPNGSMRNVIIAVIATIVAMVISFALTYLTFTEVELDSRAVKDEDTILSTEYEELEILSPIKGEQVSLDLIDDKAFKSEVLGKTVAINPEDNIVYSPFEGKVVSFAPTGHALGIMSNDGQEILVHVGIDTVRLKGKYFKPLVKQNDFVNKGDALLEFDKHAIEAEGYSVQTIVSLTNTNDYTDVVKTDEMKLDTNSNIMKVVV